VTSSNVDLSADVYCQAVDLSLVLLTCEVRVSEGVWHLPGYNDND
jgi:hypothetical protein